jgi:putative copper export protein
MKEFEALPEREKKLVRTIDIVILIGVVVLLVVPFLVKK